MSELLANVYRGDKIESQHFGDIAVVDLNGKLLFSKGNPELKTYFRSSAKPFQILPLIRSGAYKTYNLSNEELAVMCSSHSGENFHTEAVKSILAKINLGIENLKCGAHEPFHVPTTKELNQKNEPITALYNNCSGKHSGALAFTMFNNWNPENYLKPDEQTQTEIKKIICEISEETEVPTAVDGCSFPVFYLPINKMALMFAKLASQKAEDLKIIYKAMTSCPEFVGGTGRFDTEIMKMCSPKVVSKQGAEGISCIGVSKGNESFGIALKIIDGSGRSIPVLMTEILYKFGVISKEQRNEWFEGETRKLKNYAGLGSSGIIKNHAGLVVGKIEPVI
ncbi:asparaginase [bacterium]|nr:asparaginase [bacterium]